MPEPVNRPRLTLCLLAVLSVPPVAAIAADGPGWNRSTSQGATIAVDPATNKATISGADGSRAPLWDGVHRLDDGRTLTVRSGVVVPDVDMSSMRHEPVPPIAEDPMAVSPCVALVRRACGVEGECAGQTACDLAGQLMQFETEERRERPGTPPTSALQQCRDALSNPTTFPVCAANAKLTEDSPCSSLLRKVCGRASECANAVPCRAARQLADMEVGERMSAAHPELDPRAAGQCTQALLDREFFVPCR
jgi:hypothetical protein